jgi:hypothetical protein
MKTPPPVAKGGVTRFVPTVPREAELRLLELLRQSLKFTAEDVYHG